MWNQVWLILQQFFPFFIGYIHSTAYPKPLNKSQELEYLIQMGKGNENARNKLIEHNQRLVVHIAKKFDLNSDNFEDYISTGIIGLIKAIDSFDYTKGHRLTTYASKCIENEILMYMRQIKKNPSTLSFDDPIGYDKDGDSIQLIDVIKDERLDDPLTMMQLNDNKRKLLQYLNQLSEKEKRIIIDRYGLFNQPEKTQKQIAKEENISRSYVSRIEKRAFVKLLKAFKKDS